MEVYKVLPELAAPTTSRAFMDDAVNRARKIMGYYRRDPPEGDDLLDLIQQEAAGARDWLLVMDEEAFETGELGLMLRDLKGNVVKGSLIKPGELQDFFVWADVKGTLANTAEWGEGAPGELYKKRGAIMRELLPRVVAE